MQNKVSIVGDQGKGRAFVFLSEIGAEETLLSTVQAALAQKTRCLHVRLPAVCAENWEGITDSLQEVLTSAAVRQASYVAFDSASAIAQNLCLRDLKAVRSLVLVNATTRSHPTLFLKIADKIERALPLGLPLRSYSKEFDAKPFLHRLRCPVLVVTTSAASAYQIQEAKILSEHLPTAWSARLPADGAAQKLEELVLEFQNVKAKCPMKNVL